jgi:hypothetical protein
MDSISQSVSNSTLVVSKNAADKWIYETYAYLLETYPKHVVTVVFPFLSIIGSYTLFCGAMFLLEYFDPVFLRKYKIQTKVVVQQYLLIFL